jgi:hypothetical protein
MEAVAWTLDGSHGSDGRIHENRRRIDAAEAEDAHHAFGPGCAMISRLLLLVSATVGTADRVDRDQACEDCKKDRSQLASHSEIICPTERA